MKRILVTGGAGYIGSHVVKELHRLGYSVVVFDNLSTGHREFVRGEFICGDLCDTRLLAAVFSRGSFDAVMHFAAHAYVDESVRDPSKYYRNNVANTLNLLEQARTASVDRFIFSSSCATYGRPQGIPISEEDPQNPINPYGWSKLMVEQLLRDFDEAYHTKFVVFRYFNAAGADPELDIGEWHDPETHLVPLVLDAAVGRAKNIQINGTDYATTDGTCIRDYIHVSDIARAHVLGLEYLLGGNKSVSFNLGNGKGFSVRQVIDIASSVAGSRIEVVLGPRRPGDPPVLVGSSEKARAVLGWTPQFPDLRTIVETAWGWHQHIFDGR